MTALSKSTEAEAAVQTVMNRYDAAGGFLNRVKRLGDGVRRSMGGSRLSRSARDKLIKLQYEVARMTAALKAAKSANTTTGVALGAHLDAFERYLSVLKDLTIDGRRSSFVHVVV